MPRAATSAPSSSSAKAKTPAERAKPASSKNTKHVKVSQADSTKRAATQTRARAAKASAIAKAKALAPDVPVRIGSTPETRYRGNPDLFGRLVEDHDHHRALLAMLSATSGKSPEREQLFAELVYEIKGHAAAEEQALWSSVMRNPDTTEDARHAVGEHKEMDKLLADLAARDMASSAWLKHFAKVRDEYLHHIQEEEQEQFLAAEQHLTVADLRHMKQVFNARKRIEKAQATIDKKIRH